MSFFKKLTEDFKDLRTSMKEDKKDDYEETQEGGTRAYDSQGQHQGGSHCPSEVGPPPPSESDPSRPAAPSVPPGWIVRWNDQYNQWFFIDQSTGRSQWDAPTPQGPPGPLPGHEEGGDGTRGFGGHESGNHGYGGSPEAHGQPYGQSYGQPYGQQYGQPGHGGGQTAYDQSQHPYEGGEEKKSSKSGMLLGAAGGLAVGAVGGALIADAMNDSDEEAAAAAAAAPPPAPLAEDPDAPPAVLPPTDVDGDEVSESDREEVAEAREEYEEALAEAADSDASSSDHEAAEEAREEYEEAYEETYED